MNAPKAIHSRLAGRGGVKRIAGLTHDDLIHDQSLYKFDIHLTSALTRPDLPEASHSSPHFNNLSKTVAKLPTNYH